MQNLWSKIKIVWEDRNLRNRILFVLFTLVIFRVLAAIPIPGIDPANLAKFLSNNQFLGVLNIFSGGGLSKLSIIMLGVGPFITASIIMQLLTIMVPALKAMYHEEGDLGRQKFTQYSRILTIPIALLQGFGLIVLLEKQGVLSQLSFFGTFANLTVVVAGSLLLMWLGELISEYGISNGVSLIIFSGIVASLPTQISQLLFTFDASQIPLYIGLLVASILVVAGVVFITEAERPIPVTYAKRVRGMKVYGGVSTYIPLRLNQAGVIPIIFALSILLFPQMIGNFLNTSSKLVFQHIGAALISFTQNPWFYSITYFILVLLFTYFYTAVTFDPQSMSENLQKNGAFIPGIRPGQPTAQYVSKILNRITLVGALFLGLIAVLPLVVRQITGMQSLAIGGTALLIVVSVVIDLIKKVDAQISMREY
jgi:preprotein translocase subunit SecY